MIIKCIHCLSTNKINEIVTSHVFNEKKGCRKSDTQNGVPLETILRSSLPGICIQRNTPPGVWAPQEKCSIEGCPLEKNPITKKNIKVFTEVIKLPYT